MGKLLLIVSCVFVLLSAGLGVMGKMKLDETRVQLADIETKLSKSASDAQARGKELNAAKENIATLQAEKEQLTAANAATQTQLSQEKQQSTNLQTQLTAANSKVAETEAALQQKTQELAAAQATATPPPANDATQSLQAQVDELTTVNKTLQAESDSLKAQVKAFKDEQQLRITKQLQQGTEGRVLAVNSAWNFVVLSLGDKAGLSSNTELLVKRGRQLVGKVRITSVDPSQSVADIVANSVPAGMSIAPGDQVIYQGSNE